MHLRHARRVNNGSQSGRSERSPQVSPLYMNSKLERGLSLRPSTFSQRSYCSILALGVRCRAKTVLGSVALSVVRFVAVIINT